MQGHRAGHYSSMAETIALMALGADDPPNPIFGVNSLIVDPIHGNDSSGNFNKKSIKTIKRMNELLNSVVVVGGLVNTKILSSPPLTDDAINLNTFTQEGGTVAVQGVDTKVIKTGTITVNSQTSFAANTREVLSDLTVTDWTPLSYHKLMDTTTGNFVWGATVDQSDTAHMPTCQPMTLTGPFGPINVDPTTAIVTGDKYEVIEQVQVKVDRIVNHGTGFSNFAEGFLLINLHVINQVGQPSILLEQDDAGGSDFLVTQCRIDPGVATNSTIIIFVQCCLGFVDLSTGEVSGGLGGVNGIVGMSGGIFVNASQESLILSISGTYVTFVGPIAGQLSAVVVPGTLDVLSFGKFGPFDEGVQFWDINGPSISVTGGLAQVNFRLFGKSINTNVLFVPSIGVYVAGGTLQLQNSQGFIAPVPKMVGTGGFIPGSNGTDTDFSLGGTLDGAGNPVNRTWIEPIGAYSAQIICSWANFGIGPPAGFGGTAVDVGTNSHMNTINSPFP
jgi:hypothetical protein